jgi:peroxiredoxin
MASGHHVTMAASKTGKMARLMSTAWKLIVAIATLAIASFAMLLTMPVRSAPEARFSTLSGETFGTAALHGKVAVVNFWSTSCATCMAEMPKMAQAYRAFAPRGYEMVAVAMKRDDPAQVAALAASGALPFKVALDPAGEIAARFGNIHITPTTFLIDKRGRILRRFVGEPDWKEFERLVEKALAQQG